MDIIFNHCSSSHTWFIDPPTEDWFHFREKYRQTNHDISCQYNPYVSSYDHVRFEFGSFITTMPDLNQAQPDLMKYLTQVSIFWIEYLQLDGIRMDTWPYCEQPQMSQWVLDIKKEFPRFNIVGECWSTQTPGCAFFQVGNPLNHKNPQLPCVMDFPLMFGIRDFVNSETTGDYAGLGNLYHHLALDICYPNVNHLLRFLDNHDTDRFLEDLPDHLGRWRQAITILLTIPGIPQLYYGTEILMNGHKNGTDGNVRKDFPGGWIGDPKDEFTREGRSQIQNEAWDFLKMLLHWRQGNQMISNGTMKVFKVQNGGLVYERKHEGKHFLVIMNGMNEEKSLDLERYGEVIGQQKDWVDVLYGDSVRLDRHLNLTARHIYILQEKGDVPGVGVNKIE
jgi:glycosidase